LWGPDTDGFQEYETLTQTPSTTSTDPFYTAPGTYVVRTARDTTITPNQHMYAARAIIAKSNFVAYKPSVENRVSAGSVSNGHTLFDTVPIKTRNPYFNHQELTPCAGCHMDGGFSFKYGQAPSDVIHFGAVQDGFSDSDAEDILAYIQSNTLTPPVRSRWWNPLLQGGKTCGSISSADRLAGNGIRWKLVYDQDLPEYLIPGGSFAKWAANQNLDFFCIPLPITNPHWIRWFPAEHPLDFFASLGLDFTAQAAWTDYVAYKAALKFGAANNFTQLEKGTLGGSGVAYRIGAAAGTDDAKLTAPNTQAWDLNGLAFKTTGVGSCTSTNVEVGAGGASSNAVSITETLHHSLFVLTTSTSGATATIGDTKGETFVATLGSPYSGSAGLPTLYYSWYVKDTGAGANTITAAYSGSNQYPALSVVDCSNVDHVNTFDAQHSASGSGTAGYVSSGNFTTSAAGDIIIGWGNYAAAGGFPAPSILTAYEGNANYLGNLVSPSPDISAAKAATGIFDYKNTPSRGMACYQAPTFVCQASHYLSIWWSNRTLELIQAIAGLGGKHDTIIADYMLSSQGLTLDSHSGAYTPNGYFTNALFDTGPHKANIGDNCFHLQFQGLFTCANTILDTAMWYMLQFQQGNRNHFASGDNPIDVPYNYLFTGGLSGSRSMFWMSWMGNSQNAQMTWGWPNMNNMDMTYLAGKFMIGGLNTQGHDQFITEAEKATVMNEWVQQFLELKARFTVAADWQTKFPCTSPLAGGAALAWGTSSSQICQDWAMTLPILNHYNSGNFAGGPNPADIDTIQDWLQTLYPTPGGVAYNWTTERNEPCSFNWGSIGVGGNNNPPVLLSCTFQ
jgi:hypothetical protein